MNCRAITIAILLVAAATPSIAHNLSAADYRGMSPGWPSFGNGAYPAYYPSNHGMGPAYYVARPVVGTPQRVFPTAPFAYMPVTAAYGNPAYFAGYRGGAAYPSQAPVAAAAYYPPAATAAYYAPPTAAYYAPATPAYAPNYSYAVSPAGLSSAGSEASISYGQPTPLNYVPPRFSYRTTYAAVPVYAYRPVTVYDPVTAQPVTCLQPATTTTCQPQRTRCFSWWNPLTWFHHSCGAGGCGAAAPTTAYCTSGSCGQPYYPTVPVTPVFPTVPAPAITTPPVITTPIPSGTVIPPAGRTIPPPPLRTSPPGASLGPADVPPRLPPGTTFPAPGTTTPSTPIPFTPGGSTIPTTPGGSFPTGPSTSPPGFGGSRFDSSGNSFSRSNYSSRGDRQMDENNAIRAPKLSPALPPSIQTVPDPEIGEPQPINRAPQLLDPRDKTARRSDQRWAVVPAVWPSQEQAALASRQALNTPQQMEPRQATPIVALDYDDSGWTSAR